MSKKAEIKRRIKRGEKFNEGSYWSLFLLGSLCAHVLFFAMVFGPLLPIIMGLQRHEPVQAVLTYVTFENLKSRFAEADEPAKTAMPAASHANANRGESAADAKQVTATSGKEDNALTQVNETAEPPAVEINGAVSKPFADPGKEDGITFIRGDTLTVEQSGEKQNITEAKGRSHTLARHETADSGRFKPYSTVKDAAAFRYDTTMAAVEPAGLSVPRPEIGLKVPSSPSTGVGTAAFAPIGKEAASPGKLPVAESAVPVRKEDHVAAKKLFAHVSGGASEVSGPSFSDLSQKKSALPGRVFAAEANQVEPGKARAISSDKDEAASAKPPAIRLTSPAAGQSDKKIVAVKGKVSGYGIVSVVLTINGRQRELLVRGGEFESEITLDEGRNLIRVDTADASGETAADMVEVVYAAPVDPAKTRIDLVVRIEHNAAGAVLSTQHKWAPHPLSKGSGQAAAPEFKEDGGAKGGTVSVLKALPGIYTIGVGYDTATSGPAEVTFEVTVFGYDPARRKNRKIGPVKLEGKGSIAAVRLLLPEGVFWEDDGWFSGVMESGRVTTKYKMPEGIVWKERD